MLKLIAARKIEILGLLSILAIISISYMKAALELEDAEQAYYSQWWRFTYDDQPPLYTWFQIPVNKVFGVTKLSFSLLRALIFSGTIAALYCFGKVYIKDKKLATVGVLLLSFVPVFIDFTFRRLSHTSLLCLAVLLTFILIHRLLENKSSINYIVLGLVVSLGILTKYNYFLMLAAFVGVIPFNRSIRAITFNWRVLLTVLVVLLLVSPHFYDLFSSSYFMEELQQSFALKTSPVTKKTIPVLSTVFAFIKSVINLIFPLVFIFGVLFWKKVILIKKTKTRSWLQQVLISQIAILLLAFILMDVVKVETRWLLPLFIPYLILVMSAFKIKNIEKLINIGFSFFVFILFVQIVRTPIEKVMGISSSVHFGFNEISDDLNEKFQDKQWVLPDVTYGGNIRFLNPKKEVFSLDDFTLPSNVLEKGNRVVIYKSVDALLDPESRTTHQIRGFGKEKDTLIFVLE